METFVVHAVFEVRARTGDDAEERLANLLDSWRLTGCAAPGVRFIGALVEGMGEEGEGVAKLSPSFCAWELGSEGRNP